MKYYQVKIPRLVLVLFILVLIPFIFYKYFTDFEFRNEKAFSKELLSELSAMRIKVSEVIEENHFLGVTKIEAIDLHASVEIENRKYGTILMSGNGRLIIYGERYGVFITQKPEWNGEGVRWSCHGEPEEYMPDACRKNL